MNEIILAETFKKWLDALKDTGARLAVAARLRRAELGNFGDCKALGNGLHEMRINKDPGYRMYYTKIEENRYIFLLGGDKSRQRDDIDKARALLEETGKEHEIL